MESQPTKDEQRLVSHMLEVPSVLAADDDALDGTTLHACCGTMLARLNSRGVMHIDTAVDREIAYRVTIENTFLCDARISEAPTAYARLCRAAASLEGKLAAALRCDITIPRS